MSIIIITDIYVNVRECSLGFYVVTTYFLQRVIKLHFKMTEHYIIHNFWWVLLSNTGQWVNEKLQFRVWNSRTTRVTHSEKPVTLKLHHHSHHQVFDLAAANYAMKHNKGTKVYKLQLKAPTTLTTHLIIIQGLFQVWLSSRVNRKLFEEETETVL